MLARIFINKEVLHMNKTLPIVLLFGGLTIFSGVLDKAFTSSSAIADNKPAPAISATIKIQQADSPLSKPNTNIVQASLKQNLQPSEPAKAVKSQVNTGKKFFLESVNEVSLRDDIKAVIKKLGQPLSKAKDPFLTEMEVYAYPKMNIGFSDGIVSYVEVLVAAGTVTIDGIPVQISQDGLKKALGEPDFIAADDIVFQRDEAFVKLFTDRDTHEVTAIYYYHHSNI